MAAKPKGKPDRQKAECACQVGYGQRGHNSGSIVPRCHKLKGNCAAAGYEDIDAGLAGGGGRLCGCGGGFSCWGGARRGGPGVGWGWRSWQKGGGKGGEKLA